MTRSEKKKRYDGMLIFVVLLLVAAGLVILYSTSAYNGQVKFHDPFHYLKKQGFATLLGLFGMALIARVDYHKWVPLAIPAYVTSIILSVAVIFFGDEYNGSKRWLSLGCFRCLPIERIFSKAEIWSQELQFNYKFLTNATKQAFSMPTKCRASFSRPFSDYYDVLFTKLLAMLRNGLFHRLPSRRMFFVRQKSRNLPYVP